ncbi:ATP synthase subunit delta [Thermosipho melanesiensis]|uniref:ATP synthase subunit delta n=2 Tax=Thermosipho melanesiensis TaxID=46541 RepID=ATPD_THEM4|nr:F0F1 ATP synthase subunit delta [Thermosipho melanesiensis]A6LJR4.1 RecName: Full=ATP synthase subunit delta; AltName: Full=ATP synthase F(1) sector subunit delta; AltName: Full=F-type ATPase subunit delta; Short=F-ATPase subunit delta [Thermosipho melanesiensis BI429]ABR30165.1 ATP synthase F1, delta subunit [Thermosipho melanesiensis BI429]APT73364.1 ATP F0F1 synthase subunit delta [Thermosipho melanesiensis]OOC38179.1 ATP synthase subunit delta [Thermosipho melanesiensis]OOC40100.1 ATP s
MRYSTISSKYVNALLMVGKKVNKIEDYGELLKALCDVYVQFKDFFDNPAVKVWKKVETIKESFGTSIDKVFVNFVSLVFENKRQKFIPQIAAYYRYASIDVENKILVNVTTAEKLSSEELRAISEFVKKCVNRVPVIEEKIDESLIAGAVIEFSGKMIDVSVSGRLNKIAREVFSLRKG